MWVVYTMSSGGMGAVGQKASLGLRLTWYSSISGTKSRFASDQSPFCMLCAAITGGLAWVPQALLLRSEGNLERSRATRQWWSGKQLSTAYETATWMYGLVETEGVISYDETNAV